MTKAAVQKWRGVDNVPITFDMVLKVTEIFCCMYNEHRRQEQAKKRWKKAES